MLKAKGYSTSFGAVYSTNPIAHMFRLAPIFWLMFILVGQRFQILALRAQP